MSSPDTASSASDSSDDFFWHSKSPSKRRVLMGAPRTVSSPLEVSASLFVENNKLLDSLAEEVRRLRAENVCLGASVESLTEENVTMNEHLGSLAARVRQFQRQFDDVLSAHRAMQEERSQLRLQLDASSLQLIEAETALSTQRRQHAAAVDEMNAKLSSFESSARLDLERLTNEGSTLRQYIDRLERECREQNAGRIAEAAAAHQAADRISALQERLRRTEELLRIEENKSGQLLVDNGELRKAGATSRSYVQKLLASLRMYESQFAGKS